jgi:hypothetical protein
MTYSGRHDSCASALARRRCITAVVALALVSLAAANASAQLRQSVWRAEAGQVYQVLQHRAGEDLGVGIDEVRVTSVAANSFAADVCGSPPVTPIGNTVEALASGPIGGGRPLDLAYKSRLVADASAPCFSPSANDGLGAVCIGPACAADCACEGAADCVSFTLADGTSLATATPDAPAAHLVAPLRVTRTYCDVSNHLTYGFGTPDSLTTVAAICSAAPADGVRLPATPSTFAAGVAGTTIVFVYEAMPGEQVGVAAAGFGIDTDGRNPFGCDAPGRVVAGLQASGDDAPSHDPPPPMELDSDEMRCQRAIGRSSRRFSSRVLHALQLCRERILDRSSQMDADDCLQKPDVARAVRSAARLARSGIRSRCQSVDMRRLLTCGDRVDDLIGPDLASGCLYDTHVHGAEQTAIVGYGF